MDNSIYENYLSIVAYEVKFTSKYSAYLSKTPDIINNTPCKSWSLNVPLLGEQVRFLMKIKFDSVDEFFNEVNEKWGGLDKIEFSSNLWAKLIIERAKASGWESPNGMEDCLFGNVILSKERYNVRIMFFRLEDLELQDLAGNTRYYFKGKQSDILNSIMEVLEKNDWSSSNRASQVLTVQNGQLGWSNIATCNAGSNV